MKAVEKVVTKHGYYCVIAVTSATIPTVLIRHWKRFLREAGNANGENAYLNQLNFMLKNVRNEGFSRGLIIGVKCGSWPRP